MMSGFYGVSALRAPGGVGHPANAPVERQVIATAAAPHTRFAPGSRQGGFGERLKGGVAMKDKRTLRYMRQRLCEEFREETQLMRETHRLKLQAQRDGKEMDASLHKESVIAARRRAEILYDLYLESMGHPRHEHFMRRLRREVRKYKRAKEGG